MTLKTLARSLVHRPTGAAALMLGTALALTQVMPLAAQDTTTQDQVTPAEDQSPSIPGEQSAANSLTPDEPAAMVPESDNRPLSFAELAKQVSPSVVNITTTSVVAAATGPEGQVPQGSPFEDFFDQFGGPNGGPQRSQALGSGFVISDDGYIVTNNHVIEGADEIQVEFFGGEQMPAKLVGTDPEADIALLKVEGTGHPFVEFGDSNGSDAEVGDWVLAMGNPLGQGFSISAGIVSARGRELSGTYDDFIQTDAAINRGNSGGPLFDMNGRVIGVNTAILSPTGGSIGIGFAMSSDVVKGVVDQLREFGETRRGWLGVRIQDVTPDMVGAIEGLDTPNGALVTDVPEGPAKDAGVESGDVILSFDGQPVTDTRDLVRRVGAAPVGEQAAMEVLRDGKTVTLNVTLARREEAEATAQPASAEGGPTQPESSEVLGMTLTVPTPEVLQELGLDEGTQGLVVTEVEPISDAADKGLAPGDVITEAGQQPVASVADFEVAVKSAEEAGRKSLLLLVRRGGEPRFVALSITEDDKGSQDQGTTQEQ
ncbi:HtrA protease/chaperone protein [Rubellimicrobium mesophilum DSM 19309]|uniref:HtrA protease/chaperone protein n=2 Tax=Rubellimicrobium TaxID=295418 RepID=A0A017HJI6_9RHOB|nr:HtrA protease/chaperone protein [Rubellimicrobium mesophilum DSM 19309]